MYLEMYNLKNKVAVINGGARGIGYACAEALAECGANIVLTDISSEVENSAQKLIEEKKVKVTAYVKDLTKSSQVNELAASVKDTYEKIDILVNSQGLGGKHQPAEIMEDEVWRKTIDVNLNSIFWCCRAFGNIMLEQGKGSIVNIGSMSGIIANKNIIQAEYYTSKAGVHHLTKALAVEWASRGVRVNAVAPTYIATEMTKNSRQNLEILDAWKESNPINRIGEPHEIAAAVLFLGTEAASLMTGSILVVDGGHTCW
jgi:NAD(P)-dependent dehydrogenase (short-subunit alcohol dehydrogenase family)